MTAVKSSRLLWPAIIAITGFIIMLAFLFNALQNGNFQQEGQLIANMPWGILSLIDIYIGIALFSIWVVWREKSLFTALFWITGMLLLGNIMSCFYVLFAIVQSKGNADKFFSGVNARKREGL